MRDGWREARLGELAEVVGGGTPRTSTSDFWGGEIVWLTPTEVVAAEGAIVTDSQRKITRTGLRSSGAKLLPPGTVLLTSRATVGAVAMAGCELATNQGFQSLIAGDDVLPWFLLIWIQHNKVEFTRRAGGSTFPEISRPEVRRVPILLPPLDEQRRIIDLIAAVDGAIEAADSLRDTCTGTLRSLGESAWLSESFRPLKDIGVGVTGRTPSTTNAGYWSPPSVPFITPGDIGVDLFISSAARMISTDGAAVSRVFPPHSVLQVCIGATIGKVGILARPATCNQQINVLLGLEDHDALFLALTLAAPSGMRYVLDSAGKTTLPLLSKSRWLELKVPWPDAGLRQRTAQVASSLEEIRQKAARVATRLRTVRSALLSDLLSGDHEIPASYDEVMG